MEKGSKGLEEGCLEECAIEAQRQILYLEHDGCTPLDSLGGVLILKVQLVG
jgi:hypothetical protein